MASTTPQPPDFSNPLSGGLSLANTIAGGYFAQAAAKTAGSQVKSNSGLILALAGGGGLLLVLGLVAVVLIAKR